MATQMATLGKTVFSFPLHLGDPETDLTGADGGLRRVWESIQLVAPTNSAVLLQGETGTGKEVVARTIHQQSRRKHRSCVRLNCAAIPAALLESELFGHERGAFTGANTQTTGRFQQADGGTLFLDEIGDLPLELQPKLLRVLQEQEFERLGSSRTIRVDVRVIAATNQDLAQLVRERRFRADLYYRLNVFPIELPPLRERPEDIPLLVQRFIEMFSSRMNKEITYIPDEVLETLQRHDWPGNVRELQNVVERAVILSHSDTFFFDESWIRRESPISSKRGEGLSVLAEREVEMIEAALQECHGRVSGPSGAAVRLGIPRQTLESKMRSLGIRKYGGRQS
jgi:formate hydrogenlyase transcriptional activator